MKQAERRFFFSIDSPKIFRLLIDSGRANHPKNNQKIVPRSTTSTSLQRSTIVPRSTTSNYFNKNKNPTSTVIANNMSQPSGSSHDDPRHTRLVAAKIWRWREEDSVELAAFENWSFLPYTARMTGIPQQQMLFHSRTVVNRTSRGKRQTVKLDEDNMGYCHVYVHPQFSIAATVVTSSNYPLRVAYSLISELLQAFLRDYPDPGVYERQNADCLCGPDKRVRRRSEEAGQQLLDLLRPPPTSSKCGNAELVEDSGTRSVSGEGGGWDFLSTSWDGMLMGWNGMNELGWDVPSGSSYRANVVSACHIVVMSTSWGRESTTT